MKLNSSLMEGRPAGKEFTCARMAACPGQHRPRVPLQVRQMGQKSQLQVQPWTPSKSTLFTMLCSGMNSRQRKGQEDGTSADGEHEALGSTEVLPQSGEK